MTWIDDQLSMHGYPPDDFEEDNCEEYDCLMIKDTDKAWLMVVEEEEMWLPKSKCEFTPDTRTSSMFGGIPGVVTIPEWLAKRKGLM